MHYQNPYNFILFPCLLRQSDAAVEAATPDLKVGSFNQYLEGKVALFCNSRGDKYGPGEITLRHIPPSCKHSNMTNNC